MNLSLQFDEVRIKFSHKKTIILQGLVSSRSILLPAEVAHFVIGSSVSYNAHPGIP
jgi:hypothetical protein